MNRYVITIDGLAGTGKSSLAKALSESLNFKMLPSGLLYRTIAGIIEKNQVDPLIEDEVLKVIYESQDALKGASRGSSSVKGIDLHSLEVSKNASIIAAYPKVRSALLPFQRDAYPGESLIAEGRDMGTVVFPDANLKIFVEVPVELRAKRRALELGKSENDPSVLAEVVERDRRDQERAVAPAVPAKDAVIFKNSYEGFESAKEAFIALVRDKIEEP